MKKSSKIIIASACAAVAAVTALSVYLSLNPPSDTEKRYTQKVEFMKAFENDMETAVPQTIIYDKIKSHFEGELPKGKTVKKAIVIGFDGCRLDALRDVLKDTDFSKKKENLPDSAMSALLNSGGKAYISYCGGTKYPEKNTQDTSTAPGWCSMLTGQWADVHGITGNGIVKSNDHLTLLTTLVEEGTINKSAFYVSWKGHFTKDDSTYKDEVKYCEDNSLDVTFICSKNDEGTKAIVTSDIRSPECSDFIFTTLEYCDHSGHTRGFFPKKESYKNAFAKADKSALEIIEAIESRENYETEDWLILITTDHGGKGRDHGGASIQERYTFIIEK